jgi:hypothetical protein
MTNTSFFIGFALREQAAGRIEPDRPKKVYKAVWPETEGRPGLTCRIFSLKTLLTNKFARRLVIDGSVKADISQHYLERALTWRNAFCAAGDAL